MWKVRIAFALAALAVTGHQVPAQSNQTPTAGGWPQWGGPTRNFMLPAGAGPTEWPSSGPRVVWRRPLGEGYSAIAVSGSTLYTMYRHDGDEIVVALDADTGKTRWEHRYSAPPLEKMNLEQGSGPHATPLVHGGRVFAHSEGEGRGATFTVELPRFAGEADAVALRSKPA